MVLFNKINEYKDLYDFNEIINNKSDYHENK